jgi:hypothetical protein
MQKSRHTTYQHHNHNHHHNHNNTSSEAHTVDVEDRDRDTYIFVLNIINYAGNDGLESMVLYGSSCGRAADEGGGPGWSIQNIGGGTDIETKNLQRIKQRMVATVLCPAHLYGKQHSSMY